MTNISVRTDGLAVIMDITTDRRRSSVRMAAADASALALRLTDVACIARLLDVRSGTKARG